MAYDYYTPKQLSCIVLELEHKREKKINKCGVDYFTSYDHACLSSQINYYKNKLKELENE